MYVHGMGSSQSLQPDTECYTHSKQSLIPRTLLNLHYFQLKSLTPVTEFILVHLSLCYQLLIEFIPVWFDLWYQLQSLYQFVSASATSYWIYTSLNWFLIPATSKLITVCISFCYQLLNLYRFDSVSDTSFWIYTTLNQSLIPTTEFVPICISLCYQLLTLHQFD